LNIAIVQATPADAEVVASMVGALLDEIVTAIGAQVFNVNLTETTARAEDFLQRGIYVVFLAREVESGREVGLITLYESHTLYAAGSFGTIPELYVQPGYRSAGIGQMLLDRAKSFGRSKGWTRLEVTTPPLPEFERTLRFYEAHGFSISGGRKLKVDLNPK
jgi:GNAT superfamily N-acetyltransferase